MGDAERYVRERCPGEVVVDEAWPGAVVIRWVGAGWFVSGDTEADAWERAATMLRFKASSKGVQDGG